MTAFFVTSALLALWALGVYILREDERELLTRGERWSPVHTVRALFIVCAVVALIVLGLYIRYGTIQVCEMFVQDVVNAAIEAGDSPVIAKMAMDQAKPFMTPGYCTNALWVLHTGRGRIN